MTSSPSTAFCRLAPLLVLLACGGEEGPPVEEKPGAADLAGLLAGGSLTDELRAELEELSAANTARLLELAARVGEGGLTPAEADALYAGWLAEEAAGRSLEAEQLGRLLVGYVGGRYR